MKDIAEIDLRHDLQGITADTLSSYSLVHVMGCWVGSSATLAIKAQKQRKPIVYSPLGGLQPWVVKEHHASRLYAIHRQAVSLASAVHVCGPLERDTFNRLRWNARVVLIKNPVLTSLVSFDEMCRDMLSLYRKVIDSHARMLFNVEEQKLIGDLLEIGVDEQALRQADRVEKTKNMLHDWSGEQWRRLLIYAEDEQIIPTIELAMERLHIDIPQINVSDIERFNASKGYAEGPLKTDELVKPSSSVRSKLASQLKPEQASERQLCIAFCNMKYEVDHDKAPLGHLVDLYKLLRFGEADEDLVAEIMTDLGEREFAQRLVGVLATVMNLSEGFQPFPAQNGKATEMLGMKLTKFGYWL